MNNHDLNATDSGREPAQTENPTLLLVDDEENILLSLKRLFRRAGYRIFVAIDADDGLDCLQKEQIDLVISDMRMPGMDGVRFLEQVHVRWPHVVRILLTGLNDPSIKADAIDKGKVYQQISKPWDDSEFLETVKSALVQRPDC